MGAIKQINNVATYYLNEFTTINELYFILNKNELQICTFNQIAY